MVEIEPPFPVDEAHVARLIAAQVPDWAGLPIRRVVSSGTDNALFRLGDGLVVRVPRRPSAVALLTKELDWLAPLQALPLAVPRVRFRGWLDPRAGVEFGVFDWIEGQIASPDTVRDWPDAARRLAGFLRALHRIETAGAPRAGPANAHRGVALADLGVATLSAIRRLSDEIDARRAAELWHDGCAVRTDAPPVWLHGDLKDDNLIVRDGVLRGVIDWGLAAVGDPAADYAAAWSWVDPGARAVFRDGLEINEGDWLRARAWALYGAVIALAHYRGGANEALCRQSRRTLSQLRLLI